MVKTKKVDFETLFPSEHFFPVWVDLPKLFPNVEKVKIDDCPCYVRFINRGGDVIARPEIYKKRAGGNILNLGFAVVPVKAGKINFC